jgi:uncharacterized protein (TIGR02391 family)
MSAPNYRLIATSIGDLVKYSSSVNEINRVADAIFRFKKENFPNDHITSTRAKEVYDWIMSLAKQKMAERERNELLTQFCQKIVGADRISDLKKIIKDGGVNSNRANEDVDLFSARNFHTEIHKHSKQLYLNGHYFHAVFEACKVYNKLVKLKAQESDDGQSLMMKVWAPNGVLKITSCKSETDLNVQNGIKFLSAGLMQAVRNPTSHEPAVDWPISKEDCLNFLSFMTFLFKKLDDAVFFKEQKQ